LGRLRIYNLDGLQIYNLGGLRICDLGSGGRVLACILVYRGIAVCDLGTRCALASKVNSKTTWVCRTNLVKRVRYKASDYIKFGRSKEFLSSVVLV